MKRLHLFLALLFAVFFFLSLTKAAIANPKRANHVRFLKLPLRISPGLERSLDLALGEKSFGYRYENGYRLVSMVSKRYILDIELIREEAKPRALLRLWPPGKARAWKACEKTSFELFAPADARPAAKAIADAICHSGLTIWTRQTPPTDENAPRLHEQKPHSLIDWPLGFMGYFLPLTLALLFATLLYFARRKGRSVLANGAVVFFSLAVVLFLVELGFRMSASLWAPYDRLPENYYPDNPRGYFLPAIYEARTRTKVFCSFSGGFAEASCETPARFDEAGKPKTILTLGDSFTEAQGVLWKDSWPFLLETALNHRKESYAFHVANCADAGANLDWISEKTPEFIARHEPDIVIYALVLNDIPYGFRGLGEEVDDIDFSWAMREKLEGKLRQSAFVDFMATHFAFVRFNLYRLIKKWITEKTVKMYQDTYRKDRNKALVPSLEEVARFRMIAEAKGAKFLVAIFPLFYELANYPFIEAHKQIALTMKANGVEVLDLLPYYNRHKTEALIVHPTDFHPNERAQRIASEAIMERMQTLGWLQ